MIPYAGEGFAVALPSKWNPSKEEDFGAFAKTELRCGTAQCSAAGQLHTRGVLPAAWCIAIA